MPLYIEIYIDICNCFLRDAYAIVTLQMEFKMTLNLNFYELSTEYLLDLHAVSLIGHIGRITWSVSLGILRRYWTSG